MYSLVVRHLDELNDDVLAWLYLKHLEDETEERSGLDNGTIDPSNVVQL